MFSCWAEEKQQPRDMGGASTEINVVAVHRAGGAEGFSVVPGTERVLPLLLLLCFNCLAQCLQALNSGGGAINAGFASHGPPSLGGGFGRSGES